MTFIYKAIAFPFRKGATQFPEAVQDGPLIKEALVQLVMTGLGERIMRPKFGTNVLAYIFDNINSDLSQDIRREIAQAIALYEPRVRVTSIVLTVEDTTVIVVISYQLNTTNTNDTLTMALGTI